MKRAWITLTAIGGVLVVAQFVPYGRNHTNPPVRQEPAWQGRQTREFARRACFDCHSNETRWPWYSNVAPVSWFLQHDVDDGRSKLNFSEWDRKQKAAKDAVETVQKHDMPPAPYLLMHPDAKLSDAQREAFINGLRATLAR